MKKWLLPTVFITSQRLRTIIPMALWILSGVPSDTLLHDYSSQPSARLLQLCISFLAEGRKAERQVTITQPLKVSRTNRKSHSTPKCERRLKRYLSQRAQCRAPAASLRRWMALSSRNEAHITLETAFGLMDSEARRNNMFASTNQKRRGDLQVCHLFIEIQKLKHITSL